LKVALQLGLIPGGTVADKQQWASDNGVEGIEISAWDYNTPDRREQALRDFESSPVPAVSICGNSSFDFLDPDRKKRQESIAACKDYLRLAGALGAVGQIVPPIFGGPRVPDLSPLEDPISLEKRLLVEICKELGDVAQEAGTLFLLEPLNRYEQHLLRKQSDGTEICEKAGHPAVAIISDFFHMHIEETNTPQAIRDAGKWVKHVHLADNTRMEPGTGDIDFVAGFRALKEIGFDGYMAYECGISGDDKAASLVRSLEYVRECIAKAKG
jgi:sugar phosphate isomerase/epimerase